MLLSPSLPAHSLLCPDTKHLPGAQQRKGTAVLKQSLQMFLWQGEMAELLPLGRRKKKREVQEMPDLLLLALATVELGTASCEFLSHTSVNHHCTTPLCYIVNIYSTTVLKITDLLQAGRWLLNSPLFSVSSRSETCIFNIYTSWYEEIRNIRKYSGWKATGLQYSLRRTVKIWHWSYARAAPHISIENTAQKLKGQTKLKTSLGSLLHSRNWRG